MPFQPSGGDTNAWTLVSRDWITLLRADEVWQRDWLGNWYHDPVFANAGIIERQSFYSPPQGDHGGLVPTFDIGTINVNLSGVIFTSHVALQFFRRGEDAGPKSIIMTSSSSGLYPNLSAPIYAASKHGIVGFMRSIAQRLYSQDGISVNCINPGTTRTGIIGTKEWNIFPADCISTPEQVAIIVKSIIESSSFHGQAVEIVVDQTFPRGPPPFLDERMERLTACADRLIGWYVGRGLYPV